MYILRPFRVRVRVRSVIVASFRVKVRVRVSADTVSYTHLTLPTILRV